MFFLFVVYPALTRALEWMGLHPAFLFVLGMFYGVVLVDVIISFNLAVKIKTALKGVREAIRYDDIKAKIKADQKNRKKRVSFLFAFRGDKPVTEYVKDMLLGKLKRVPVPELPQDSLVPADSAVSTGDHTQEEPEKNDKPDDNKD